MLKKGKTQVLRVHSEDNSGYYLRCEDDQQVFMPGSLVRQKIKIGSQWEVFIYVDGRGDLLATPNLPPCGLGDLTCLKVINVTEFGAYVDMGLPKDLLIPHSLQKSKMELGNHYLVKILEDPETGQFCGTTRVDQYVKKAQKNLITGQGVSAIPYQRTPLGFKVLVNNAYLGMIFHNEIVTPVSLGATFSGQIKTVREDGKLDILLGHTGGAASQESSTTIMEALAKSGGHLKLGDRSPPDAIRRQLGISKKSFKKGLGALYKQRLVILVDNEIFST